VVWAWDDWFATARPATSRSSAVRRHVILIGPRRQSGLRTRVISSALWSRPSRLSGARVTTKPQRSIDKHRPAGDPTACPHPSLDVVNWYELVPKYRCNSCECVLICDCESTKSVRLVPDQARTAGGPGFQRVPVHGFAHGICHHCRGITLPPAPRAALKNQKGKVQRYYWREIRRQTFETLAAWLDERDLSLTMGEMRKQFPDVVTECKRDALEFWKNVHSRAPRYDTVERDQESFLRDVPVPTVELRAPYEVRPAGNNRPLGRFRGAHGQLVSAEQLACEHYESEGWEVHDCERRLINALCGVFLSPVYQDPTDPRLITGMRGSTDPQRELSEPRVVHVTFPDDFGTPANYERRKGAYISRLDTLMSSANLVREFESLIQPSIGMREYLAVHEAELGLVRRALSVISQPTLCGMLDWAVRDFWSRRRGWPDLFLLRAGQYRFAEVKSRKDRLSQEQIAWFEWAHGVGALACEIVKVLPGRI